VEQFQVDDLGTGGTGGRTAAQHDAEHERIAADVGRVVTRRPEVEEVARNPDPVIVDNLPWTEVDRQTEWDADSRQSEQEERETGHW
jgi:hypothetical protein